MFVLASLAIQLGDEAASAADAVTMESAASALRGYVGESDDSYEWRVRREGNVGTSEFSELILTSQTWRDVAWKHQLYIITPSTAKDASQALLLIGGGSWREKYEELPAEDDGLSTEALVLASVAETMGTPVCVLAQVPHQPMFGDLHEDEIISYTFVEYLKSGDATWPLLLPMVKSAVRGMDAVQEHCDEKWGLDIQNFTVTGGSKRGWTTWLTSAVDDRVNALAPMVIDVLNMGPQMKHQLASFGAYSEQIEDYTEKGIQSQMDTEQGRTLNRIVDPFHYLDQIEQPKIVILGTNDPYWPLDACNLYWDDVSGDKYVLYCPNQGHGIKDMAPRHRRLARAAASSDRRSRPA